MANNRLHELFGRWYNNQISPAEKKELADLLAATDQDQALSPIMKEAWEQLQPDFFYPEAQLDLMVASIMETSPVENEQHIKPLHRIHFLRTAWFRYAAAIIIVFGIGAYLWTTNKKFSKQLTNNSGSLPTDVLPGGDKAVLTLADGSKIVLDSAANGDLAQQGNAAIVKLASGQIAYNPKGLAASDVMMNTMTTPKGGQYQLLLPDGSKVWLNAASSIQFPAFFTGKERKVKITGEVYFEIAKNKEKPFIVDVDRKQTVEVLGTHFNINAYGDEDAIRTTLLEGKVRISATQPQTTNHKPQTVLIPGEQAILTDHLTVTDQISIDKVMAWKNGIFNFDGLEVRAVMAQLARWYDIDVKYEGTMPSYIFRGRMYRSAKLSTVLENFRKMGVDCKLEGKTVIVSK